MSSQFYDNTKTDGQPWEASDVDLIETGMDLVEDLTATVLSKSVAGNSDVTLTTTAKTADEQRNAVHEFTGALTGNISVIVSTANQVYRIYNNTSGSYTLTVKVSGQTGVLVPQGEKMVLYCDGTDVVSGLTAMTALNVTGAVSLDSTVSASSLQVTGTLDTDAIVIGTSTSVTSVDEDITTTSASHDTLPSALAVKTYVDAQLTASDLDFQGDSGGALSIDLDADTLDIAGGTGIDTSGASTTLTVAIDSTVATLTGSQVLSSKTLDASLNTLSNIDVADMAAAAVVTEVDDIASNDNDTTLPTSAAVIDYVLNYSPSATLNGLTDTTITAVGDNDIIAYDTTAGKYINQTAAEVGLATDSHNHSGTYEPADATIVKDADIGVTVQAYDADTAKLDTAQTWTATQTFNGVDVTGTVTADGGDFTGGAFTSTGIDDNATSTAITIDASGGISIGGSVSAASGEIGGETIATLGDDQAWTGSQRATVVVDNDGIFDMDAGNDFYWTPTGADLLGFTASSEGQRGMVRLVNPSGHAITIDGAITAASTIATDLSVAGNHVISYWCYSASSVAVTYGSLV